MIRDNKNIVILLAAVFLAGIGIAAYIYYGYYLADYLEVNASITVAENIAGRNADPGSRKFGKSSPGGEATRYFIIDTDYDAKVRIKAEGNISQFLGFSDTSFVMEPGEAKKISVTASIPGNASLGYYEVKVKVYLYRSWFLS